MTRHRPLDNRAPHGMHPAPTASGPAGTDTHQAAGAVSPPTATRSWGPAASPRLAPSRAGTAVIAVLALGLLALAAWMPRPRHLASLRIDNPTDYAVSVESASAGGGGWVTVALIRPRTTAVAQDVVDEGDTWTLRFRAQGHDAGSVVVTRQQLASAGWSFTVPDDVAQRLSAAGAPVPP